MFLKFGIAAAAAAGALLALPATAQAPAAQAPAAQRADALFAAFARPGSPGCALGVDQGGRMVLTRAWGMADLEHGIENGPATIFEAGSVSKQFTAAAILLLAQDGKLALGDDIRRYVPEMPDYGEPITIDHLLSHTSGLRDWGAVAEIEGWPRTTRAHSNADALLIIARQSALNYYPGREYSYTNSGYNLMAVIVERVSGRSLAQFTRERMFEPLGMRSTSWRDDFRRIVPGRAIAYGRAGAGWEQLMPFENAYGNGGLLTTVGDLLIWNEALTSNRLGPALSGELQRRARLHDGTEIGYARGLVHEAYGSEGEISHAGSTGGYRAWLGRYPGERLSVALLCNAGSADAPALARSAASLFAPSIIPPTAAGYADPAPFAGLWVNMRSGMPLRLEARGGRLAVVGGPELHAIDAQRFAAPSGVLAFESRDAFALRTREGESVSFRRVEPWAPTPQDLALIPGLYRGWEADATYEIRAGQGGLVLRHLSRPEIVRPLRPAQRDVFEFDGGMIRINRFGVTPTVLGISFGTARVRELEFRRIEPPTGVGRVQDALATAEIGLYVLQNCRRHDEGRAARARMLRSRFERLMIRAGALYGGAFERPIVSVHPQFSQCVGRRYATELRRVIQALDQVERILAGYEP